MFILIYSVWFSYNNAFNKFSIFFIIIELYFIIIINLCFFGESESFVCVCVYVCAALITNLFRGWYDAYMHMHSRERGGIIMK